MGRKFELVRETEINATPEQVWDAVTAGTGGWLWPMEFEPRVGGAAAFGGTVTAWDPPRHFTTHAEGPDGWFNTLDEQIEVRDGRTILRYVHSGIIVDDWDTQYDGADKHTDFYQHTLKQYVENFPGRRATYVAVDAPEASNSADAISRLLQALDRGSDAALGDAVRLPVAAAGDTRGELDFLTENFVGIRTPDALYRFFGRHAWGGPVSLSIHAFGEGVDVAEAQQAWTSFFTQLYAGAEANQVG